MLRGAGRADALYETLAQEALRAQKVPQSKPTVSRRTKVATPQRPALKSYLQDRGAQRRVNLTEPSAMIRYQQLFAE